MEGYLKLAEALGVNDVVDYIKELEKKFKEAVEGKDVDFDLDFEVKIRERLREVVEKRFNKGLNALKSLAVLDLPVNVEVARDIYDLEGLKEFRELGLIVERDGYIIIDETLKDIIREDFEEYHRKALEYYSRFEENLDVMTEKAYHYLMLRDYDKAFEYFMKSANQIYGRHRCVEKLIFVGEKLINKVEEKDRVMGTVGNLYMVLKKYDEAETYYRMVIGMYDREDVRYAGTLLNLANLKYVRGDYNEAENLLKECLSVSIDKHHEIAENALLMLSSLYLDLGKYEKAESCLMDVLRMAYGSKSLRKVAEIVNNLGYVYSRSGNYEKAERFYKEALRIYNELNDVKGVVTALNNLCSIYVNTKRFEDAKEIISLIESVREVPPDLKAKYYFLKAKVVENENPETALELYFKAGSLGFLVFRNFGINAINYMHALDKAEEIAERLKDDKTAGDVFLLKSTIAKIYFGVKKEIANVKCGERGKALLTALRGQDAKVEVRDEIDSAFYVVINDLINFKKS